jgi:hypothetical protein
MSFKNFVGHKYILFFIILILLGAFALVEFLVIGNNRYTLVFYTTKDSLPIIEDRMIPAAKTREEALTRYTDEVLLGPIGLDLAPLFPAGTRIESLFYRNNDVFINLSETAALAPLDGIQDTKKNLFTLVSGVKRNFPFVGKVVLFVNGNEVFFDEYIDV